MNKYQRAKARIARDKAAKALYRSEKYKDNDNFDSVITTQHFIEALVKCRVGVSWKGSVQLYTQNAISEISYVRGQLKSGTLPELASIKRIILYERGKRRVIVPITIKDRMVQRVLCDHALVPRFKDALIYDNGASMKGKGVEFTRERMMHHIKGAIRDYGMDEKQVVYNEKLLLLSKSTGVPLIAGTDTHVLNAEHEKGRSILQASKNIMFDGEERWDLKFKTYDELVAAYRTQGSLPEEEYMQAIENTNLMADMVEPFELDRGTKYPHIYSEPEKTFHDKIQVAVENHPYALKHHTKEELQKTIDEEFEVYKATKSIDFMLLQTYLREWEKKNGIQCGYGRGSVSGSMIAYLLGITQMDSMRYGLNFFRFMNPSRVTNADIDTDYSGKDRETIKRFLLKDKMNLPSIRSAEIITFNTIALKGAIRDVCRALYRDRTDVNYLQVANHICKEAELHEDAIRKKYPEVFKYLSKLSLSKSEAEIAQFGIQPFGGMIKSCA